MAKLDDARAILKAKEDEMKSKGISLKSEDSIIASAYSKAKPYSMLFATLRATNDKNYIKIADFMEESLRTVNTDYEKARAMIKNGAFDTLFIRPEVAKTTYKEFLQIDRRTQQLNERHANTLKKFQEIANFMKTELPLLNAELVSKNLSPYSPISELLDFFNNSSIGKLNYDELKKLKHFS